jgi:glutamate racemase
VPNLDASHAIGVFDSGVGGLSVWREIVRQLPHERTIYVADQAHVPYGLRHLAAVQALSEAITRFLLGQGTKIVVVACNTASAAALRYLRRTFPRVPFVGMEPAIKPATERTRTSVVGVLATPVTYKGKPYANLMGRYAGDTRVLPCECSGLVEAVEAGQLDTPRTEGLLRVSLSRLIEERADQLVLGCTHFPFLRPVIERIMGPDTTVIDPAPAVARQTERMLRQRKLLTNLTRVGQHVFYTSGDVPTFTTLVERLIPAVKQGTASIEMQPAYWHDGHLDTHPSSSQCKSMLDCVRHLNDVRGNTGKETNQTG